MHLPVLSRFSLKYRVKRGSLKQKYTSESGPGTPKNKGILGGADYVTLLMGGRRKVEKEAKKLPQDN